MKSSGVFRIRLISGAIILVVAVLMGKLYLLQIVSGKSFRLKAERQYVEPAEGMFDRGNIFFETRDGTVIGAAVTKTGFTIALNPRILTNPEHAYDALRPLIVLDRITFMEKAGRKELAYAPIARKISETAAKKVEALALSGIIVQKDPYRFYPAGTRAAHEIGFVGWKGNELSGRYGLENYYNDTLARDESGLYKNFFAELFSGIKKTLDRGARFEGDLITSLEPTLEEMLQQELGALQKTWASRSSGGVIMDPKTGEIYAMGSIPDFDPNALSNEKDVRVFSNPIVENVYEMGSIIKPLTMAAGIDSGAITAETTYDDKGFLILNGSKISNFDGKGRGVVNMQTVLNDSLNTGAAFIAKKMGHDLFADYFTRLGLGEETGIDMPNEARGLVKNLESRRDIEHATASFGQGIAMSPIATLRSLATLANSGFLVTPHLGKRIDYRLGVNKSIAYPKGAQVIQAATSEEVTRMLVEVVDKALLGGKVKMPHYSIAAKTGTAQIANPSGGGYYTDKYLHSFFGYFPAYDPKFIIFLYTIEPKGVGGDFASRTLTTPFMNLVKFLITYYKIPPDR